MGLQNLFHGKSSGPDWVDVRVLCPEPLTLQQSWLVGLGAQMLLDDPGQGSCARLHPSAFVHPKKTPRNFHIELQANWEISDFPSLMTTIVWLLKEGQRYSLAEQVGHPPLAWDYGRVVALARHAFAAEIIDQPTAWDIIESVARPIYRTYNCWGSYTRDFWQGRKAWNYSPHTTDVPLIDGWAPTRYADSLWQSVPWCAGQPE